MLKKISKIAGFLKDKGFVNPVAGIILGTGLGSLATKNDERIGPRFPDMGIEGKIEYTTHESVQAEAVKTEERMTTIITGLISTL
jgi:purine nucleoside phosphorylase